MPQVHSATLVDGRRVVLKLQHVEVRRKMTQDLMQAEALAETLAWLEPQIDLRPMLSEANALHRLVAAALATLPLSVRALVN